MLSPFAERYAMMGSVNKLYMLLTFTDSNLAVVKFGRKQPAELHHKHTTHTQFPGNLGVAELAQPAQRVIPHLTHLVMAGSLHWSPSQRHSLKLKKPTEIGNLTTEYL